MTKTEISPEKMAKIIRAVDDATGGLIPAYLLAAAGRAAVEAMEDDDS